MWSGIPLLRVCERLCSRLRPLSACATLETERAYCAGGDRVGFLERNGEWNKGGREGMGPLSQGTLDTVPLSLRIHVFLELPRRCLNLYQIQM